MREPVDIAKLRKDFADLQMPGVVSLIDMFAASKGTGRELLEIGSSSLGEKIYPSMALIYNAMAAKFPDEPFSFFYIGRRASRDGKRPALTFFEHLELIRQVLVEIPPEPRADFDRFCGVFVESHARLNRLSARIPNALRQWVINIRRKLGLRISDDLLLGVSGWWWPKRRRKPVDVEKFVGSLK